MATEARLPRVMLISGSTRAGSTNSALVRTALACAPAGIATVRYGMTGLPYFNPDDDREPLPPAVVALRAAISACDAVLISTPEYAGTMPGTLKNLLEWTVGGTEMTDLPVCWVNVAADPRRGRGAEANLATVLGYVQARVVPEACRHIPVTHDAIDAGGLIADPGTRAAIADVLRALVTAVHPA